MAFLRLSRSGFNALSYDEQIRYLWLELEETLREEMEKEAAEVAALAEYGRQRTRRCRAPQGPAEDGAESSGSNEI